MPMRFSDNHSERLVCMGMDLGWESPNMGERRGGGVRHYSSLLTMENKKYGEPQDEMFIKVQTTKNLVWE